MKYHISCVLFGHKFVWTRLVETETSKQLRAIGLKTLDVPNDFIQSMYNTDTCVKCGLTKEELGITGGKSD